jgi:ribosomal protein L21
MAEKKTTTTKKTSSSKKTAAKKPTKKQTKKTRKSASPRTAVLAINNMQYIVKEGETIATRISLDSKNSDVDVKLLALLDGDKLEYGKPHIDKKVDFELGKVKSGEKVTTAKFKSKSRYRRRKGFRKKFVEFTLNQVK